ncbi:response regulator [Deinococcus taeanensis]|uniref:response regulator n=1 Tax=Deinococcus taeanensis TaxID=2737050 RepID=UPI001CDD2C91|nr:response regulator [Deinococcus taeanensis]UBV43593.1 response regulator [Deinococcus taeanensis]
MTGQRAGVRLLVVDDEEQILELLDLTLSLQGYEVYPAASGPAALERLERQAVDVIVMDVLMAPWDGFETVRRLAERHGAALPPVVFLSGLARPAVMPELGSGVVEAYLVKPFRPAQLVEKIEEVRRRTQR